MRPTIEWKGDNAKQIEQVLREHAARVEKDGTRCHITGSNELDVVLDLGDRIVVEGDRLGVMRQTPKAIADPEIIWTGANVEEMAKFLGGYAVRVELRGDVLCISDVRGSEATAVLRPGDKLIERGGMLIVSKLGKDHRA